MKNEKNLPANFKKVAYKITYDSLINMSPAQERLGKELHHKVQSKSMSFGLEKKLKKAIEKYPNSPAFKNYLSIYYRRKNNTVALEALLTEIDEKHPDYLFGRLTRIEKLMEEDKLEEVDDLLGEGMNLKALYPERDVFHISEVLAYNGIVVQYFLKKGEIEIAESHLKVLQDIEPEHPTVRTLSFQLMSHRMRKGLSRMQEAKKQEISYETETTFTLPSSDDVPVFHHEEINAFYENDYKVFPPELAEKIINLPRETLIADLNKVLEDAIIRYQWFSTDEWDENTNNFTVHAFRFLAALDAKESLQHVLNLLRQDDEFTEYWYADWREDRFIPVLYQLGKDQLDVLFDFVIEPYNNDWNRNLVSQAVVQIAGHDESRKTEVIEWFRKVLQYHLDNKGIEGIISTNFINFAIVEINHFRMVELIPEIKAVEAAGWIVPMMGGSYEDIIEQLNKPFREYYIEPFPLNIKEAYDESYKGRRTEYGSFDDELNLSGESEIDDFIRLLSGEKPSSIFDDDYDDDFYEKPTTIVRTLPKVGRNDPCPCGSGKKHKKCCLRKK